MEIRTILIDLPTRICSFVHTDVDGYTIVLNARLSAEDRARHYQHEIRHILEHDFEKDMTADEIEYYAHRRTE